jgi:hypothetical protein
MQRVKHLNICAERLVELEIVEFGWFGIGRRAGQGDSIQEKKKLVYKDNTNMSPPIV